MENLSKESLPLGWELQLYKDVVETISTNGKKVNQKQYETSGTYPIFDQGQSYCSGYLSDEDKVINAKFPVLVFGDHTRAVKYVKEPFVAGADGVKVLEPNGKIIPELLLYFTQYLAVAIKDKGYARHYQWVAKEQIGIPPLQEQRRIVEKIEELFSELDSGIKSLTKAKQQLSVYRQALLKQAFEGKLTAQWREDNPDKLESPGDTLERLKRERDKRYQQKLDEWEVTVNQWKQDSSQGKKPSKPRKPKAVTQFNVDLPDFCQELPDSWFWDKLGHMTLAVEYGTSAKSSESGRVPVLRMGNIQNTKFDWGDLVFTSDEDEISKYTLNNGDVLFNRTNSPELVGKTAKYNGEREALFAGYLIRVNQFDNFVNSDYLNLFLNSYVSKRYGNTVKTDGVNQSNINGEKLSNYPFPYCSLAEQEQVVQILEEKISKIERSESEISMNLKKAELLRQSILKKAFSGKLVSQDSEDEPANELLKKIAIEKEELVEEAEKATVRKKKPTAKKTVKS
ncbi:restriction endonuclease subunit S [Vibrio marisflavi]|uniref:Type I restriction modification DNA specificity domain-containing protein n=1 Tax=Vibrio marisflavi CECT 7928 TaxID=634439 RepID=A0ABM9A2D9_9VIBR|nr:restriction endonuclease subunit S [Vibrio marisflavi]CAH0538565.1 hypothetical protein VMF7928_01487 [Vibrio marisflavi CECT 7928]